MMYTLLCHDSLVGVFSAVYEVWSRKLPRDEVCIKTGDVSNYELFMEYLTIEDDPDHAQKVIRTLKKQFGPEVYEQLCYALWSNSEDKANVVFLTIRYGIENHIRYNLLEFQTLSYINRVFELKRSVFNESHHYLGFVRFSELEQGLLFSKIEPKNYIIEVLAEHFADRLPMENWVIYDSNRSLAALHQAGKSWALYQMNEEPEQIECLAEDYFQSLWKVFCKSISIEARENWMLQRQNLPLRFRNQMTEFK